ncbi:LysR family transcriptional regulator [Rhizorhabdus wittichii DC-6]|nr:LysR family transcriptional regulator [Rhizorhabdus wittichii DC-6]
MRRWETYEAFIAVVECGSFTAAAERLRLSKSAISRSVSSLEARLGSQLLFRTTRRLAPTDLGRSVYRRCVELFDMLAEIDAEAMEHDASLRGKLRIVASDSFGECYIAPLAAEMMRLHEQLEIEFLVTDRTIDIVADGYDMAIRYNAQVDSSLKVQKLYELPHICAASPEYLLRAGTPFTLADLMRHNCLVSTFEACHAWRFGMGRTQKTPNLSGNWCSNNGPALLTAALNGIGIVWLPELYLRPYIKAGALIELLGEHRSDPMPVWAVYPARRQAAKVRAFIDYVKSRLPAAEGMTPEPHLAGIVRPPVLVA